MPEEEIAKRREWLQGVDPKEAAKAHARFVRLVAPLCLRRREPSGMRRRPLKDLWDLVTIMLLHSGCAAKPAEPAAGGR